jgi:hypothetical protein
MALSANSVGGAKWFTATRCQGVNSVLFKVGRIEVPAFPPRHGPAACSRPGRSNGSRVCRRAVEACLHEKYPHVGLTPCHSAARGVHAATARRIASRCRRQLGCRASKQPRVGCSGLLGGRHTLRRSPETFSHGGLQTNDTERRVHAEHGSWAVERVCAVPKPQQAIPAVLDEANAYRASAGDDEATRT